jgi:hypothetical protein
MIGPQVVANRPENVKDGGRRAGAGEQQSPVFSNHEWSRMNTNQKGNPHLFHSWQFVTIRGLGK